MAQLPQSLLGKGLIQQYMGVAPSTFQVLYWICFVWESHLSVFHSPRTWQSCSNAKRMHCNVPAPRRNSGRCWRLPWRTVLLFFKEWRGGVSFLYFADICHPDTLDFGTCTRGVWKNHKRPTPRILRSICGWIIQGLSSTTGISWPWCCPEGSWFQHLTLAAHCGGGAWAVHFERLKTWDRLQKFFLISPRVVELLVTVSG